MTALSARELTLRGFLIALVLTVLFTASNVYLGLKVGLTFATSIPAAVISMAILKFFKNASILENNIVQTLASSAGTLSAIVFILPALVMVKAWTGFPFWQTFFIAAIGGILGVMYTIPLRRALVVHSDLPYPEGTAAAHVLMLNSRRARANGQSLVEDIKPIRDISLSAAFSFLFSLLSSGFKVVASGCSYFGQLFGLITGIGVDYTLALVGAGYLVGIRVALAILLGMIISWLIAVPWIGSSVAIGQQSYETFVNNIWVTKVRFIGAGTIAVAALWAILCLLSPIYKGFKSAFERLSKKSLDPQTSLPIHERDMPILWVFATCLIMAILLAAVFSYFIDTFPSSGVSSFSFTTIVICTLLAVIIGFLVSAVSGYMAGLVGSSNSPVSGIGLLAIIVISLVLLYVFHLNHDFSSPLTKGFVVALALFTTSVVFSVSCVANDNLQDLKTGYLVGATPWKQQVALVFGVIIGALVLAPVLNSLYQAYGFSGALPRPDMDMSRALVAPQATLMAAISSGIITHTMEWDMLLIGVIIGVFILILNGLLVKYGKTKSLSILSVGIGIYLPAEINTTLIIGGFLSFLVNHLVKRAHNAETLKHIGTLLACGFIVGSSIFGIVLAILIQGSGNESPLQLISGSLGPIANVLGPVCFLLLVVWFYSYLRSQKK
jgi:putative OPT family oligopeptide transporter